MPQSTAMPETFEPVAPAAARRRLPMAITLRPSHPWEHPRVRLQAKEAPHATAAASPEHRRRAELSRQLALMAPQLVHQLLTVALRAAAPQHRHELLVRQLRETAPAKRLELLALHLRTLGGGLVRAGALADDEGQLPAGVFEDGSLEVLLSQLGVEQDAPPVVTLPGVSPLRPGLSEGDGGRAVVALQARLMRDGYLTQAAFAASPGAFDPATAAAVRAFQSDRLLPATGDYGVLTHLALLAAEEEV